LKVIFEGQHGYSINGTVSSTANVSIITRRETSVTPETARTGIPGITDV
jgi:branched-subunit amino acid aminotransferase/4-amino-4-deoxychorismate lyase